jgi:hypothetical protein
MNQTFFGVPGPSSAWAGFLATLAHANVLIIEPNLSESLVDSFLVPAGRRRRAIAPQRSCVDSADCDSEGDESSPGPAPVAPARAVRASGEHGCCDKKLPIPNSSDIEAFPDFEPGKQYPVRSAPRPPIPATLARATTSAQYQWVGSQPEPSKLVKPAPKVRKNPFKCSSTTAESHPE